MRGVLSLLLARCLNPAAASPELRDQVHQQQAESGEWILPRQKSLAEQVEMISVAQDMHETIVNLPKDLHKVRGGGNLVHVDLLFLTMSYYNTTCRIVKETTRLAGCCWRRATSRPCWEGTSCWLRHQLDWHKSGLIIITKDNCMEKLIETSYFSLNSCTHAGTRMWWRS